MLTRVDKAWGYEEIICNEAEYCAKNLIIAPGKKCSLHYHNLKKETFLVKHGMVKLEHGITEFLMPGEQRTILPGTPHRFSTKLGATILEISTHHYDDDVTRLEPSGDL